MDGFPERRGTYIAACFLVVMTILVGLLFMGGQTSKILSTVGAAVGNPLDGSGSGSTDEGSTGSGSDPAA